MSRPIEWPVPDEVMHAVVAFVRARLADDETLAAAALAPDEMHPWGDRTMPQMAAKDWPDAVRGYLGGTWGEHCARNDPARVLHRVRVWQALLDVYRVEDESSADPVLSGWAQGIGVAIRIMSGEWSQHPDYRQEWSR